MYVLFLDQENTGELENLVSQAARYKRNSAALCDNIKDFCKSGTIASSSSDRPGNVSPAPTQFVPESMPKEGGPSNSNKHRHNAH